MKYNILDYISIIKPIFIETYVKKLNNNIDLEALLQIKKIGFHYCLYHEEKKSIWTLSHLIGFQKKLLLGQEIVIEGHYISELNFMGKKGPQGLITPGMKVNSLIDLKLSNSLNKEQTDYSYVKNWFIENKEIIKPKIENSRIIDIEEMIKTYKKIGNNGALAKRN